MPVSEADCKTSRKARAETSEETAAWERVGGGLAVEKTRRDEVMRVTHGCGELEVIWEGIGDSGEGPFPSGSGWKKEGSLKWVGRTERWG